MENKITNNLFLNTTASVNATSTEKVEDNDDVAIDFGAEETYTELLENAIETFSGILFGDDVFTSADAEIFVNGEKEIAEILAETKDSRSFWEILFDPNKHEREIRTEYEKDHPDYARVAKQGKQIQEEFKEARSETEKKWIEDHPEPETKYERGKGLFGFSRTEEYKTWLDEKKQALSDFEEEYRDKNPDYDNLADAIAKNKSILEYFFKQF